MIVIINTIICLIVMAVSIYILNQSLKWDKESLKIIKDCKIIKTKVIESLECAEQKNKECSELLESAHNNEEESSRILTESMKHIVSVKNGLLKPITCEMLSKITDEEVDSICCTMRHDYNLISQEEKNEISHLVKSAIYAIRKELDNENG